MTAPVTQAAAPDGFRVQFVLPTGVTVASAPEPLDARVHLREMPPGKVAVIRLIGLLVGIELQGPSGQAAGGAAGCRSGMHRRGGLALQRGVHALVHAAQRDLAAPGLQTQGRLRSEYLWLNSRCRSKRPAGRNAANARPAPGARTRGAIGF